jgi:triosephosphate isomerase
MSVPRTPLIAGNWKMFKTRGEAAAWCSDVVEGMDVLGDDVDLAVCPPFTSLDVVAATVVPRGVGVLAQTAHQAASGPFTGEVSAPMAADAGATGVLLGHSERRQYFNETDEALAEKVPAALAAGLSVILCVGETEAEREAGATDARLTRQLETALRNVGEAGLADLAVAYEPIWAIGTGRTATPELAQAAHAHLRARLEARYGAVAHTVRLLYGGSVKPENAADLLAQPDVDGALVGGASLEAASFLAIAAAATP